MNSRVKSEIDLLGPTSLIARVGMSLSAGESARAEDVIIRNVSTIIKQITGVRAIL
jgi:hypothetical protein